MLLAYVGVDKINFLQFDEDSKNKIRLLYHQKYNNDFLFTGKDTSYLGFKDIIAQAVDRLNISDKDIRVIVQSETIVYKKIEPELSFNFRIEKYVKKKILNDKKSEDHVFAYFVNKNINFKNRKLPRECYYSIITRQIYDQLLVTFEEQGFKVLSIEPFLKVMVEFFIDEFYSQFNDSGINIVAMRKHKNLYVFIFNSDELLSFEKHKIEYSNKKTETAKKDNQKTIIEKLKEIMGNRMASKFNLMYFPLSDNEEKEQFKKTLEKNTKAELKEFRVPVILNDLTEYELRKYIEVAALYKKTVTK